MPMPIYETFSKRLKKQEKAGQPDVYQYEVLPPEFRNQVIHIWMDALGAWRLVDRSGFYREPLTNECWRRIHGHIARELGAFHLGDGHLDPFTQCCQYLQNSDTNGALDIV